ncbi:transmembrane protein, putative, partial [Rhizoctonia solani AG-3 Rhs1AP]
MWDQTVSVESSGAVRSVPVTGTSIQYPGYPQWFIGSATTFYSAWGAWMFLTGFIARRIMEPRVQCLCDECSNRREEERKKAEGTPGSRPVSGMVARLMLLGNKRPDAETNDEEQDTADPETSETKHRPDSLNINNLYGRGKIELGHVFLISFLSLGLTAIRNSEQVQQSQGHQIYAFEGISEMGIYAHCS